MPAVDAPVGAAPGRDETAYPPCRHYVVLESGPRCLRPGREAPRDCLCEDYAEDFGAVPGTAAGRPGIQAVPGHTLGLADEERTRCEVWTRVMGYHRPVSAFNQGKQAEHAERQHFRERR